MRPPILRRRAALLAAAVLAVLAGTLAAHAEDKAGKAPAAGPAAPAEAGPTAETAAPAGAQQAPGWAVNCADAGKGLACKALQTIVLAKTRQLLLSVSVSKSAEGKDGAMLLHLPHGIFLPAGVTMAVDEAKAEALTIQTCDAKGCYAGAPITLDKLDALTLVPLLKVSSASGVSSTRAPAQTPWPYRKVGRQF